MKKFFLTAMALTMGLISINAIDNNTVEITYNGTAATVSVASNISSYITNNSTGSHVKLVQSASVNASVGEITYVLKGSSSDGEFYLEGSYKATVELQGLTLTNPSGPAINIQDGKRIEVSAKKDTENTLTDGTSHDGKGCFVCKGHTEFKGKGTLNVYGNTAHAIWSKEYVEVKNLTLNVLSAVKDGINCNEYFLQTSGTISISGVQDDGIQVSVKETQTAETTDHEDEDSGNFYQEDGTLNITLPADGGKFVKTEGSAYYRGGTHNFSTTSGISQTTTTLKDTATIVNLQGMTVSQCDAASLDAAYATLPKGVYLIKTNNKTIKINK